MWWSTWHSVRQISSTGDLSVRMVAHEILDYCTGVNTLHSGNTANNLHDRYQFMKIQLGEQVQVFHRTDGNGKLMSDKKPHMDKVSVVYSDGAVRLHYSGEVWKVQRKDGILRTSMFQQR